MKFVYITKTETSRRISVKCNTRDRYKELHKICGKCVYTIARTAYFQSSFLYLEQVMRTLNPQVKQDPPSEQHMLQR